MKKLTTEEFITKAKSIHGEHTYDYSHVNYINAKTKVKIFCNKCQKIFEQTPNQHDRCGCMKCGLDRQVKKRTGTLENFIERANILHNFKYDYSEVVYINARTKVKIKCPTHGEFYVEPDVHLRPTDCPHCGSINGGLKNRINQEEFINRAKSKHGDSFLYESVNYINNITPVKIYCKTHDLWFEQSPSGHYKASGCKKCRKNVKSDRDTFIEKSKSIYGLEKYDYSNVKYVNSKTKVELYCNDHNFNFKQTPNSHYRAFGCEYCIRDLKHESSVDNSNRWQYSDWFIKGERSKNFESYKVYIIKCWNDEEYFYKIGKTFLTINNRYPSKSDMPYEYEIVKILEGESRFISELEDEFKKINKKYRYSPKLSFAGQYECFTEIDEYIMNYIIK